MKMPVIFQSSWDVVEKPIYSNNQVVNGYKAILEVIITTYLTSVKIHIPLLPTNDLWR